MTIKDRISPEDEFAAETIIRSMEDAPQGGMSITARDRKGNVAHIRWRTGQELDPG